MRLGSLVKIPATEEEIVNYLITSSLSTYIKYANYLFYAIMIDENNYRITLSKINPVDYPVDSIISKSEVAELVLTRTDVITAITFIDPTEGWRWGFPKPIPAEKTKDFKEIFDWCVKHGLPKSTDLSSVIFRTYRRYI